MPYEDWWTKNKMSKYYYMFCTPNKLFAKGGVRRQVNYNRFEFIEWKKRGYGRYIQRMWKGKGYGYRTGVSND